MTEAEFIKTTTEIEKYYQEEYNAEQRKYIYDTFKELPKERYAQIVQRAIKNCKYLPKIANLLEMQQLLPKEKEQEKPKVECKACNGTGFVFYIKNIPIYGDRTMPYQYVARCLCENGKNQSQAIPDVREIGLLRN